MNKDKLEMSYEDICMTLHNCCKTLDCSTGWGGTDDAIVVYIDKLQNNWNELKKLIDERIGDCRYFLANADVNYEKENMKKFMWLKEELQVLKSKAQELEQGKDG